MTAHRQITTGVDNSAEYPNTYRVFAECEDEYTELILMNVEKPDLMVIQKTAIKEHQGRCSLSGVGEALMTALVERPDLSQRTALSKSVLTAFDLCPTKVWHGIHDPRPFVPNEKVTFGSAVDAGVEVILKYARSGQPVNIISAISTAESIVDRDETPVDMVEVGDALRAFVVQVTPNFDWALAGLQSHLSATLEGLGECDGHPDIILADNSIYDVKTAARPKEAASLELGFYALLAEEVDPTRKVPKVGYLNYIRSKKPYWQIAETPVTNELRRWAYEKSAAYVRARKADVALNRNGTPQNYSMTGSAKFASLCADCPYNPALGGPCLVALNEPEVELVDG